MKELFTKENIKKAVIAIIIAVFGYFGYDAVISPKPENVKAEIESVQTDSTKLDSL